jgi:intracellular septation protein
MTDTSTAAAGPVSPGIRLALEAGPLAVFFVANQLAEIMTATALFMAAAAVAVALSIRLERRVPLMPLIGCGFVLAFGGLTLALDDDLFIKIKPTVVNLLFAAVLFSGLALRRDWLKLILGQMMSLTDRGWRILTWRWAVFFVFLAIVNEVVWRSFSTEFWAGFKLFGMLPLTMTFALLQVPTILKHAAEEEAEAEPGRPAAAEADD